MYPPNHFLVFILQKMSSEPDQIQAEENIECPICGKKFHPDQVNVHANKCLNASQDEVSPQSQKRPRILSSDSEDENVSEKRKKTGSSSTTDPGKKTTTSPMHQFFTKRQPKRDHQSLSQVSASSSGKTTSQSFPNCAKVPMYKSSTISKPNMKSVAEENDSKIMIPSTNSISSVTVESLLNSKEPLAERMRPKTLKEFVGQEQAIGRKTMLHSLLENNNIPSMIIWGPPGCGKVLAGMILNV